MGSLVVWLSLIEDNFIPPAWIKIKTKQSSLLQVAKNNFLIVNFSRYQREELKNKKIFFGKFKTFQCFIKELFLFLRKFIIYQVLYYHSFDISGCKKDGKRMVKMTFGWCKSAGVNKSGSPSCTFFCSIEQKNNIWFN